MKICFYINKLGDGGAERVIANLANSLSFDHEIVVINSFRHEAEYPLSEKVRHVYIDNNAFKSTIRKNFHRISFLRSFLKKEKPDVAISFMREPNFRLLLASFGLKTKVIVSCRNDPRKEYKGFVGRLIVKTLFPLAKGYVFQTEEAKQWFSKKIQNKSSVILNAVKDDFFAVDYNGEKSGIVSVGRLTKQKNHRLLISAYAKISPFIQDKLVIYGQGELEEELKMFALECGLQNRVVFAGQIDNVSNIIGQYKLFVLSSDYEGMPNALMEAMAVGLPCISTDCPCGGPRAIIHNLENGVLVRVGDKDEMASSILKIIEDKGLQQRISENAKLFANNEFNSKKIVQKWEEYILKIAREGK